MTGKGEEATKADGTEPVIRFNSPGCPEANEVDPEVKAVTGMNVLRTSFLTRISSFRFTSSSRFRASSFQALQKPGVKFWSGSDGDKSVNEPGHHGYQWHKRKKWHDDNHWQNDNRIPWRGSLAGAMAAAMVVSCSNQGKIVAYVVFQAYFEHIF